MGLTGKRTFVGFGLGAIQTGLFLCEAQASGNFGRMVVAEVIPETIQRVRANKGYLTVNIAHSDHIEAVQVGPIEVLNPAVDSDRQRLVAALASAEEVATAVPGVAFYCPAPGPRAISEILRDGLQLSLSSGGPCKVIYTAENDNHAAEILRDLVMEGVASEKQDFLVRRVRFLNTVIGKMSGVVSDPTEIAALELAAMTPGSGRAILVEAFNKILISRIDFAESTFERGITTFIEKDNLLPFEEAKLFGHNATHALGAYLGQLLGAQRIADLPQIPGMVAFLRRAFLDESGAALIHRYRGFDPLFTRDGYADYVDDLLARMFNPYLSDTVERVGRDVERKLGWDDRLVGTLRLALAEGVMPVRYALGAAAALASLDSEFLNAPMDPAERLSAIWGSRIPGAQERPVVDLIRTGLKHLRHWYATSPGDPRFLLENL